MSEVEWVGLLAPRLEHLLNEIDPRLRVYTGKRLAYSLEIESYGPKDDPRRSLMSYQTDLLVREEHEDGSWTPRLVIEVKIGGVTSHDAITYSQKATAHKNLHPYLRYGFLIGHNDETYLPGRLIRHGLEFDFMLSWSSDLPSKSEVSYLAKLAITEVEASRSLERIVFNTRAKDRDRFFCLHRPLVLMKE